MNNYSKNEKILEKVLPVPENLPKIYFLGDTGAGKTTIIRKILGTDKFNFPTTRQTRTTVAITGYIISYSLPFKAIFIFKSEEQIAGYIHEILQEATYKAYKGKESNRDKIVKYLKQTNDQRFRLYYIIPEDILAKQADYLLSLFPKIDDKIQKLQKDFPEDKDEMETFIEWALEDLKDDFKIIENDILIQIREKVTDICNGYDLCAGGGYYQFSDEKEQFILKCKSILASEKDSISPVIDYARIQGNFSGDFIDKNIEVVLIDGEGIGHDTKEASQLRQGIMTIFINQTL